MILKKTRFALAGLWFAAVSLLCLVPFVARWRDTRNNALFCRLLARPMLGLLGLRAEVLHPERMHLHRPCVFVANHQTNFDVVVFSLAFPSRTVVVAKQSLTRIPVFGWLLFLGGNLLIDRSNHKDAMGAMRAADDAIQGRGTSIFFFPEGTRSHGKGLGPLRKGAFVCAARNGVPLVPVVASSTGKGYDFGRWRAGEVRVEVCEPIPTGKGDLDDLDGLMERVRTVFEETTRRLDETAGNGKASESVAT